MKFVYVGDGLVSGPETPVGRVVTADDEAVTLTAFVGPAPEGRMVYTCETAAGPLVEPER